MGKIIFILSIFVCLTPVAAAQTDSVHPSVSVVGEAAIKVAPDQVVFTFEVVTVNKEVAPAKQANDTASARTLAAVKEFNITPDDVQTDSLTISPKYTGDKDPRGSHVLLGYEVTKRILITLKDLTRIDAFLSRVIEAGVNRVVDISIGNSNIQKYEEQVRAMAVSNARERAAAYAKQLGQTIGKAYVIREEGGDFPDNTASGSGYGDGNGDGDGNNGDIARLESPIAFSRTITFALGKISVEEKIYVIFELK